LHDLAKTGSDPVLAVTALVSRAEQDGTMNSNQEEDTR
jgi:hypothetical protein